MRVLLVGDSQALGLSPALEGALRRAGHELVGHAAENGISTRRLAEELARAPETQNLRPDLAIVLVGGNDVVSTHLPAAIVALRAQLPAHVIWVGPLHSTDPDVAERHASVAGVQRALAGQVGYTWVDGAALAAGLPLAQDGVHFTRDGYVQLAIRVARALARSSSKVGLWLGFGAAVVSLAGLAWYSWKR
jgi:lysophospholipase L1-like esterase